MQCLIYFHRNPKILSILIAEVFDSASHSRRNSRIFKACNPTRNLPLSFLRPARAIPNALSNNEIVSSIFSIPISDKRLSSSFRLDTAFFLSLSSFHCLLVAIICSFLDNALDFFRVLMSIFLAVTLELLSCLIILI